MALLFFLAGAVGDCGVAVDALSGAAAFFLFFFVAVFPMGGGGGVGGSRMTSILLSTGAGDNEMQGAAAVALSSSPSLVVVVAGIVEKRGEEGRGSKVGELILCQALAPSSFAHTSVCEGNDLLSI